MTKANPINIRLIDHVVVRVINLNAMIAFYCDVLGCRLERGPGTAGLAQLRASPSSPGGGSRSGFARDPVQAAPSRGAHGR